MLRYMRKNAASFWIKLIFGLIVLVFASWGIGGMVSGQKIDAVAWVNDHPITGAEVERAQRNLVEVYRNLYQDKFSPEVLADLNLRQQALDQLIRMQLLRQEAERLGLTASDEEVRAAISATAGFQTGGRFDRRRYLALLRRNNLTPADFEESEREQLLVQKVQDLVTSGVYVAEQEVHRQYAYDNERISLRFVRIRAADFAPKVTVTDADIAAAYGRDKEEFREPERVRIQLASYTSAAFAAKVTVEPAAIEARYRARGTDQPLEEVLEEIAAALRSERADKRRREQAAADLKQARAGTPLDSLAKESGASIATLGPFARGDSIPGVKDAAPILARAFATAAGEIGDVVETEAGSYLVRVVEKTPGRIPALDAVRETVARRVRQEKSRQLARTRAQEFLEQLKKAPDPEAPARESGLQVEETSLFSRKDILLPGLGRQPQLQEQAFALSPEHPVADGIYEVEGDSVVAALNERAPLDEEKFEAQKDSLAEQYRNRRRGMVMEEFLNHLMGRSEIRVRPGYVVQRAPARAPGV